ncbi:MAG: TIGR00266 family protein [Candidatus Muiribacterium halophilum]|uniref:TIGR00266 family protein n=1 Tax=Muiribacterium halophilum TaxID=2053465 RepID=A0A2N5ZI23_MUIH1|nr:MAG: TIGR00266 family protein [Candidatus Muirbacterium halophilum]
MEFQIKGDNLQFVIIKIDQGEELYAEAGKMFFKMPNVKMETKAAGEGIGGKIMGAIKRKVAGESLFTTHFTVGSGSSGVVSFAGEFPGRIEAVDVSEVPFLAQKDAFICAENTVDFNIEFQKKIGAGLFGGEGFILEKFSGKGKVFIHAGGDFFVKQLQPGEKLQVDTGSVVGFESTVKYDVQLAEGIMTALFGGEGLFLTTLEGPGKVILQSMTLSKLRRQIGVMRHTKGGKQGSELDIVGNVVNSFFGGSSD